MSNLDLKISNLTNVNRLSFLNLMELFVVLKEQAMERS